MTTPQPASGQQPHEPTPQHGGGAPIPAGYGGVPQAPAGYGAPAPGGHGSPGAQAAIDFTVQGSVLTRSFVPPTVRINGHALKNEYGRRVVPVPAGPVRVDVECQWMRTYGQASLSFTAGPGQTVPVFYAAPMHQFTTGSIGHETQKAKGVGLVWGILGVLAVVIVLAVLLPIVLG